VTETTSWVAVGSTVPPGDCSAFANLTPTGLSTQVVMRWAAGSTAFRRAVSTLVPVPPDALAYHDSSLGAIVVPSETPASLYLAGGLQLTHSAVDGCVWFPYLAPGAYRVSAAGGTATAVTVQPGETVVLRGLRGRWRQPRRARRLALRRARPRRGARRPLRPCHLGRDVALVSCRGDPARGCRGGPARRGAERRGAAAALHHRSSWRVGHTGSILPARLGHRTGRPRRRTARPVRLRAATRRDGQLGAGARQRARLPLGTALQVVVPPVKTATATTCPPAACFGPVSAVTACENAPSYSACSPIPTKWARLLGRVVSTTVPFTYETSTGATLPSPVTTPSDVALVHIHLSVMAGGRPLAVDYVAVLSGVVNEVQRASNATA